MWPERQLSKASVGHVYTQMAYMYGSHPRLHLPGNFFFHVDSWRAGLSSFKVTLCRPHMTARKLVTEEEESGEGVGMFYSSGEGAW